MLRAAGLTDLAAIRLAAYNAVQEPFSGYILDLQGTGNKVPGDTAKHLLFSLSFLQTRKHRDGRFQTYKISEKRGCSVLRAALTSLP